MITHLLRAVALPLLGLGLFLTGCENAALPTAATPPSAPVLNLATGAPITLVRQASTTMFSGAATVTIGPAGGTVRVGHHELVVPAGAVDTATSFTMQVLQEGYIDVRLEATRWVDGQQVVVGTAADPFARQLQLRLSYWSGVEIGSETSLLVTYLVDGDASGTLRGRDTWIDLQNKVVVSYLDHFSRYAIGEQ